MMAALLFFLGVVSGAGNFSVESVIQVIPIGFAGCRPVI
jgi:hypothetical protein